MSEWKAKIVNVSEIQPDASVIVTYDIYKDGEAFSRETVQWMPDGVEGMIRDKLNILRAVEGQKPNEMVGKEIE